MGVATNGGAGVMGTVLVISFSDLANDPRVNRQLRWLAGRYRVVAAGLADPQLDGVEFISLVAARNSRLRNFGAFAALACGFFDHYYWQKSLIREALPKLAGIQADVILANDIVTVPLARRIANGARIVLDAHEYAPLELEDVFLWNLLLRPFATALCVQHIPHVDAMTTVCEGIAEAYDALTGVHPAVLTNAPDYQALAPRPYRDGDRPIRLIHHGILYPSRKIENMILMMDHVDSRFELNLMLLDLDTRYRARLEAMVRDRPAIRFLPPVPMRALPAFLNQFDIGLFLLEPVNFNYRLALPNKLFEFIQGRLGVAIGPSPEMARVVTTTGCGVVAPDFKPASLAACLNRLDARAINALKQRSHDAAWSLSAQANEKTLLEIVERVLEKNRGRADAA
jgi:hypothetical protein